MNTTNDLTGKKSSRRVAGLTCIGTKEDWNVVIGIILAILLVVRNGWWIIDRIKDKNKKE